MEAAALIRNLRSYRRGGMKVEGQGGDRDKQHDTDPTAQLENVYTGLLGVHRVSVLIAHRCSLVKLVYRTPALPLKWPWNGTLRAILVN